MKNIIQILTIIVFISCSSPSNPQEKFDRYFGTIINKSTNLPAENISINLFRYKLYNAIEVGTVIDTFYTDSDGMFYFDTSNINNEFLYKIWINLSPNNSKFTTISSKFDLKSADLEKFYIYEFTNLKVEVRQTSDSLNCSLLEISLPRYSTTFWAGTDTFYLGRALGNTFNTISLKCLLENNDLLLLDSVFCPLNKETIYSIEY